MNLPYFDALLRRLDQRHPLVVSAFSRHVHWGYWQQPSAARHTADDYAQAAEALTLQICRAAQTADGQFILDVGCGIGGTVASLNENFSHVRLVGINIDARQLQRARRTVPARTGNQIDFAQGDACALPVADGVVDRVLAVECIFHFPDRQRFFAEAFRVLKPGGYLALSDFVPQPWFAAIARIGAESVIMQRAFGRCVLCTGQGYRRLALDAGFLSVLDRDMTAHTLPTYAFMRTLSRQVGARAWDATSLATRGIEMISRFGAVGYRLLVFYKPA